MRGGGYGHVADTIRVGGVEKTPEYQVTWVPFKYGTFGCLFAWAEQYRLRGRTGQGKTT